MTNNTPAPVQDARLTDDEIRAIWVEHGLDDEAVEDFARAIESSLLSKLRAPVADELPHWEEVSAKLERDETLTPLEFFIYENEPAGGDGADAWRDQLAAALASAPLAGEAQPSDIDILGLAGQYIQPSPVDVALQIVNFSRALLSRYAAPQASEAVREQDHQQANAPLFKAARRAVLALAAAAERDSAFQRDYDALSAALSAQPGAQKEHSDA